MLLFFFFFFQAEDGIRDVAVTGVQTCALPIWMLPVLEAWRGAHPFRELVPVSATEGTNCDRLLALIMGILPEHPPFFPEDATSDQPETFWVAEIIREKVFLLTRQEVPYAVAVRVGELVE